MSHERFDFRKVGVIAIVGVLILGAVWMLASRAAWSQGYMMGQLAASQSEEGAVMPYALGPMMGYGFGYMPRHSGGFPLLLIGLGVLFFFGVGHRFHYRMKDGKMAAHWRKHGHCPPWWGEEEVEDTTGPVEEKEEN
ncbi:MAG: hypothetical protein JXA33_17760 [Anaerolineae bacterium]|nr:hypothetical protein [Anaerolineae bacterium]